MNIMPNRVGYVQIDEGKLHYLVTGTGKRLLIAFHGYGSDATMFLPLCKHLEDTYTVISVDLPYHGQSQWADNKTLRKKDLARLAVQLMKTYSVEEISLLGYSIGARACLSVFEQMPEKVNKILLTAPDGLVFNAFYRFVTGTFIGKHLFKSCLSKPQRYVGITNWLKKTKMIDASLHKFAMQYLQAEDNRKFLLQVWPSMRAIMPDRKKVIAAINANHTPVYLFMGSYDRIIPPRNADRFVKQTNTVQLYIVEKGHRVLDNDTIPQMAACLLS